MRDLSDVVSKTRLVDSENLITLLVAVPKHQSGDWYGHYEKLAQYVVPRSSRMVLEEGEFQLYTVTLFKRTVDAFKTAARERGFQVRDVNHDTSALQTQQQETRALERDAKGAPALALSRPLPLARRMTVGQPVSLRRSCVFLRCSPPGRLSQGLTRGACAQSLNGVPL